MRANITLRENAGMGYFEQGSDRKTLLVARIGVL